MELTGKITKTLALQSGQGKNGTWKKQEYVIEYGDQYPKLVCFNLWGDKIDQYALKDGETVTVHFDVESREYNGRYYTDVKAWRIDRNGSNDTGAAGEKTEFGTPSPEFNNGGPTDDLPF